MTLTSGHLGQSGFIRWRSNKTSHTIVVHKSKGVFRDLHSISDNSVWFRTKQNTLKSAITLHGVGIHSGSKSRVTLSPAPEHHGIQMEYQGVRFPVIHNYVSGTALATKITSPDQLVTIQTVEHLMAALWGSGVDNALIKLESENNDSTVEVPIMDGSALPFCRAVQDVGIQQQTKPRKVIKVKKHVEVVDGPKKSLLAPSVGLSVAALIDFQSSLIGKQLYNFDPTILSFQRDIAPARTFVVVDSEEAAESLKTIFKGGSLDNALVFTKTKLVGNPTLRFDNEPARHKILDVIGDLALTRYNLLGSYMGICPGHRLNQLLLSKLFEDSDNYQVMDAEEALKEQSVI